MHGIYWCINNIMNDDKLWFIELQDKDILIHRNVNIKHMDD